jgi:hypothetical protein
MKVIDIVLDCLLFNIMSPIARSRLRFVSPMYFDLLSADYYYGWIQFLTLDPILVTNLYQYYGWIQFLTLDPILVTNLSQSWSYMASVWCHVALGDRSIDR